MVPDWSDNTFHHYGVEGFEQVWNSNKFDYQGIMGQRALEQMLDALSCTNNSLVFQAGAFFGIYPLMASVLGCYGMAIEGNPAHIPFIEINAHMNNFGDRFVAVNAFLTKTASNLSVKWGKGQDQAGSCDASGSCVPALSIDSLMHKYFPSNPPVPVAIVDCEGTEQDVLLGAQATILRRQVAVWVVEVWFAKHDVRTAFPGIQLLVENGYSLYNVSLGGITMHDVVAMKDGYCKSGGARSTPSWCLMDVLAVRPDIERKVVDALRIAV